MTKQEKIGHLLHDAGFSLKEVISLLAKMDRLPDWGVGHSHEYTPVGTWDFSEDPPEISMGNGWHLNVPIEYSL
jgi:hypothetical protein